MHKLLALLGLLMATRAAAAPTVREISFAVWHEADGKRYRNQVKESYTLGRDGVLHYTAYFGGMPTNMNHMDGVDWKSGPTGANVLAVAVALVTGKVAGVDENAGDNGSDSSTSRAYIYVVGITRDGADSGAVVKDAKSPAHRRLHAAVTAMLAAFEKATHRPYSVDQLPQ